MTVSRRDFLKSAGVTSLATAVTTAATVAEAQTGPRVVGPGDVPVTLMVNGKRLELKIEPRVTLLDAIRNRADLTGNKRVCDRGTCGACTMIVDGRTVYSCSTLAIEVQGKQIRTVDGLAIGERHAASGAAGVLRHRRADVRLLHAGLRRRHRRAARETSERDARADQQGARRQHLPLRHVRPDHGSRAEGEGDGGGRVAEQRKYSWPEKPVLLGTAVKRLDGPDKVTGRARYTYDINRPGMIYGKMVRSPYRARARRVGRSRPPRRRRRASRRCSPAKEPGAQVMYQGDPVAAVAADTEERARDAARLIRVRYERAAALRQRRAGDGAPTRRPCSPTATRARRRRKKPAISTPASPRPRTSSRRPTRRT